MNFFKNLFRKAAARFFSFAPQWARYAFSQFSIQKLVTEGYKKNSAVSACATTLQLTFPEPPLLAGEETEGRFIANYRHPITQLLKKPNADMGLAEFLQFAITYNAIGGNCYIWKQRSMGGAVIALYPFSDLQIRPLAGRDTSEGFVRWYELDKGNGETVTIPKNDIIHWKWMIDPEFPWKGIGAVALCAREVDKDSEATAYVYALLKNNAVPPLVVNLEEDDDSTQDEIDAMGRKWLQKHSEGQPAFVSAGMKVTQLGYDLNKLAGDSLADVPETRIAANFHVPPSVAGLNVGVKRSDYGDSAARKAFTEQTLMALWRSFASEMENGLRDEFATSPNFVMRFDLRNVGALQEQKKDQWERVTQAFNRSLLTRGQAKEELGLAAQKGDDVYFVSLASEFVPAGQAVVRDEPPAKAGGIKSMKSNPAAMLRRLRVDVAQRMKRAVDVFFSQLADRIVDRLKKSDAPGETKKLPNASDLMNANDGKQLETIVKRFYVEIIQLSWGIWDMSLGVEKTFDLTDPLITHILSGAGAEVKEIQTTTLEALRDALKYGNENGWSIDQLVRGDENQPGLRDIIDETYKGRAETIARTELGNAQNEATVGRYKEAGVALVEILDNGSDDDDEECKVANGQIWTLSYFEKNLLEHPNCTRAAAPIFGDVKPDRS